MSEAAERPVVYPREAVLDIRQVAAGLGVGVRTVERMHWLPVVNLGPHTKRFIWGQVLDILAERAA